GARRPGPSRHAPGSAARHRAMGAEDRPHRRLCAQALRVRPPLGLGRSRNAGGRGMTARAHPRTRAVAIVASVATRGHVATVAPVASAAALDPVATVAPVAIPPAPAARAGIPVATVATGQNAVATANALMNKG